MERGRRVGGRGERTVASAARAPQRKRLVAVMEPNHGPKEPRPNDGSGWGGKTCLGEAGQCFRQQRISVMCIWSQIFISHGEIAAFLDKMNSGPYHAMQLLPQRVATRSQLAGHGAALRKHL